MKTYTVKPEGINSVRKRVLIFGAAFALLVLARIRLLKISSGQVLRFDI